MSATLSRRDALRLGGAALVAAAASIAAPLPIVASARTASTRGGTAPAVGVGVDVSPTESANPASSESALLYRALDTDFGPHGVQPQAWFDAARLADYDGFITTLHTNWGGEPAAWTSSQEALERALNAGMWIAAYGRPVSRWREALSHLPVELRAELRFFALDVEVEPGSQHPMHEGYARGVQEEFGVRPLVYSGWGMWGDVMGQNADFAHLPLWDFSGDRTDWPRSLAEKERVAFGGWNIPENLRVGWQVQMQTPVLLNGIHVDRNVFSRTFIDS